jgi:hypothetical protein
MIDTIFTAWYNAIGQDFFLLVWTGAIMHSFLFTFINWWLK